MASHKDPKVNDKFEKWLQGKYGQHRKIKAHQGKEHNYLGMLFTFKEKGIVDIDMSSYVLDMLAEFPMKLDKDDMIGMLAAKTLFNEGQGRKLDRN